MMRAEAQSFMSLARNVATVGSATLLSRLIGFLRDVGIAAVLGAGVMSDAYFAALQIPNLFRRLLAEGALNSAFVPMWLRIREHEGVEGTRRFGEQVLGTMLVVLGVTAVVAVVFAPVAVAAAILNAEGRVAAAAFALVIFNGVFVAAVVLVIVVGGKASFFAGAA